MSSNRKEAREKSFTKEERSPNLTLEKLAKNKKKKLRDRASATHTSSGEESQPAVKTKAIAAVIDEPIAKRQKKEHRTRIESEEARSGGGAEMELDTKRSKRASLSSEQAGKRDWLASLLDGSDNSESSKSRSNNRSESTKSQKHAASLPSQKKKSSPRGGRYEWPAELIAAPLPSLLDGDDDGEASGGGGGGGARSQQHFLARRQERKQEKKAEFAERQHRREMEKLERQKPRQHQQLEEDNLDESANAKTAKSKTPTTAKNQRSSEHSNSSATETEQQRQARLLWEGNAPSRKEHTQFQKRREPFRKKDPVTRSFEQKQKRNSFKSLM